MFRRGEEKKGYERRVGGGTKRKEKFDLVGKIGSCHSLSRGGGKV